MSEARRRCQAFTPKGQCKRHATWRRASRTRVVRGKILAEEWLYFCTQHANKQEREQSRHNSPVWEHLHDDL